VFRDTIGFSIDAIETGQRLVSERRLKID